MCLIIQMKQEILLDRNRKGEIVLILREPKDKAQASPYTIRDDAWEIAQNFARGLEKRKMK